jgi:hypothetical protein
MFFWTDWASASLPSEAPTSAAGAHLVVARIFFAARVEKKLGEMHVENDD